jgi:C2H2-type zinc finger
LICDSCLSEVNRAYEVRKRMRNAEELCFGKLRKEVEAMRDGKAVNEAVARISKFKVEGSHDEPSLMHGEISSFSVDASAIQTKESKVLTGNVVSGSSRVKRELSMEFKVKLEESGEEMFEEATTMSDESMLDKGSVELIQLMFDTDYHEENGKEFVFKIETFNDSDESDANDPNFNEDDEMDAHTSEEEEESTEILAASGCSSKLKKVSSSMNKKTKTQRNSLKSFQCPICNRIFSRKDILQKHIETVHEKKTRFICTHCPKAFYRKNHL